MGRPRKNPYTFARHLAEDWDFYETVNTTYDFVDDWLDGFLMLHRGTPRHKVIVEATTAPSKGYPPFGDAQKALTSLIGGEHIYNLMWRGQDDEGRAASKWCVVSHVNRRLALEA